MVDVDFQYLPLRTDYEIDVNEIGTFDPYPGDDEYDLNEGERPISRVSRFFSADECNIDTTIGAPSDVFPRHTHAPTSYQVSAPLDGRIGVNYVNNDGEKHRTEVGPDEYVRLLRARTARSIPRLARLTPTRTEGRLLRDVRCTLPSLRARFRATGS